MCYLLAQAFDCLQKLSATALTTLVPPSTLFTGREDVLRKMKDHFSPSAASSQSKQQHIFVLYGMGGAGKTQIALKFIQQNSDQ